MSARYFASSLLAELRGRAPRAAGLRIKDRGNAAIIGIDDGGEFLPLFKLTGALLYRQGFAKTQWTKRWERVSAPIFPAQDCSQLVVCPIEVDRLRGNLT
jgi:hypothetical protein